MCEVCNASVGFPPIHFKSVTNEKIAEECKYADH